jgi:dephospho-CoA kinase
LRDAGVFVVDADAEAKSLMQKNDEIRAALIQTFGPDSFLPDGALNRQFLAREAFEKGRVEELNAIVHPILFRETDKLMEDALKNGYRIVAKEAALLLNYGRPQGLHLIILVTAPEDLRITRTVARDGATAASVKSRIAAQKPESELAAMADIVVENTGDMDSLRRKAEEIVATLKQYE